jgi:hypothetical protein
MLSQELRDVLEELAMPKSEQLADKQFPRVQGIVTEVVGGGFTVTVWLASSDDSIEALTLITDEPSASADAAVNLVRKLAKDRGISGDRIDLRFRLTTVVAAPKNKPTS